MNFYTSTFLLLFVLLFNYPNGEPSREKAEKNDLCGYFVYVSHKNSYGYDKYNGTGYGAKQGFYYSKSFPYHYHNRHVYDGKVVTAWAAYGSPMYTSAIEEYIKEKSYNSSVALSSRGHALAAALVSTSQSSDTTVVTVLKGCVPAILAGQGEDKLYITFPGGKLEVVNTIKY